MLLVILKNYNSGPPVVYEKTMKLQFFAKCIPFVTPKWALLWEFQTHGTQNTPTVWACKTEPSLH